MPNATASVRPTACSATPCYTAAYVAEMAPRAKPSRTAYRGAVNGDDCGLNSAMQATMMPPIRQISMDGPTTSGLVIAAVHTQPAENAVRMTNKSALNAAPDTVMRSAVTPAMAFRNTESRNAGL